MRVLAATLCAVAPLGLAGVATAQTTPTTTSTTTTELPRYQFRMNGRGYGHGIGMSQYGAQGAALAGLRAESIIGMYFPGTVLKKLPTTIVRVLIAPAVAVGTISSDGDWTATDTAGVTTPLPPGPLTVRVVDTTIIIRDAASVEVYRAKGDVLVKPVGAAILSVGARRYRGQLRLTGMNSRYRVINVVDLEKYLPGVVPLEMPASWSPQALRAQVIAARSYAMATRRSGEFDMYADERSQMYGGVNAEDARTNAAVATSAGLVATYGGVVATTFFSSTSGGRTEAIENAWSGARPVPYLVSVSDATYDAISPRHIWVGADRKVLPDWKLAQLLGLAKPVLSMRVVSRSPTGRALNVRVVTRSGEVAFFTGAQMRARLGLPSTWFTNTRQILGIVN